MLLENNSIKTKKKGISAIVNNLFINITRYLDFKSSKNVLQKI